MSGRSKCFLFEFVVYSRITSRFWCRTQQQAVWVDHGVHMWAEREADWIPTQQRWLFGNIYENSAIAAVPICAREEREEVLYCRS